MAHVTGAGGLVIIIVVIIEIALVSAKNISAQFSSNVVRVLAAVGN
jgi:hypothetical protein